MHNLAIVIPAYKIDFFEATLKSLASQTCKDFTVYVGDDCSPSDFASLIERYKEHFDIVYEKFETNLGGKNLVNQWTRCIDMTQGEPWIWLFSDDDVIGTTCVESFYREQSRNPDKELFHFDVKIIDSEGAVIKNTVQYPSIISSEEFYKRKGAAKLDSFVVEYIFSRKVYDAVGGFQNFDLAWGSDVATWCKMGMNAGIYTIDGDFVYWRKSEKNITPNLERSMAMRKFCIDMEYFSWAKKFFGTKSIDRYTKYFLFRNFVFYSNSLLKCDFQKALTLAVEKKIISSFMKNFMLLLYPVVRLAKRIKGGLK